MFEGVLLTFAIGGGSDNCNRVSVGTQGPLGVHALKLFKLALFQFELRGLFPFLNIVENSEMLEVLLVESELLEIDDSDVGFRMEFILFKNRIASMDTSTGFSMQGCKFSSSLQYNILSYF